MSLNMMDLLKGQLGGMVANQIGKKLGMDASAAESGIGALLPTILGGLIKQVSTPDGASKLDQTLQSKDYDGGILDNLGDLFGSNNSDDVSKLGGGLVEMLFGNKVGGILEVVSKLTGMGSGKGGSLLAMLLPVIMSFLGKQKRTMGLDAGGMADLLMSQKDHVAKALPAGMSSMLGLGDLGITDRPAAQSTRSSAPTANSDSGGGMIKLLAIPVIALLSWLGYSAVTGGKAEPAKEIKDAISENLESLDIPKVEVPSIDLPDATAVTDQLKDVFGGYEKAFKGITNEATAQAAIPELTSLNDKLGGVSSLMDKLPAGVKETVIGQIGTIVDPLKKIIEKVLTIPGVGPLLQPIVDTMFEKVTAITG